MAAGLPAFERMERAFRDQIAELRGLLVLREQCNSAGAATSAEHGHWVHELARIDERVGDVERLAAALEQDVDEEIAQLERACDMWRRLFVEQKHDIDALVKALPAEMRPAAATAPPHTAPPPAAHTNSAEAHQQQSQQHTKEKEDPKPKAKTSATAAAKAKPRPWQKEAAPTAAQPQAKRKCVRKEQAGPAVGGALKPRHVTKADLDKVPKYMRGRLTADKCNEALDELARLIDERERLLALPTAAVARLKPPQSDQYQRFRTMQLAARDSRTPVPARFVSEQDFVDSHTLRLDNTGKMLFSTLRHMGTVREFLCANQKCFTLL